MHFVNKLNSNKIIKYIIVTEKQNEKDGQGIVKSMVIFSKFLLYIYNNPLIFFHVQKQVTHDNPHKSKDNDNPENSGMSFNYVYFSYIQQYVLIFLISY